MADVKCPYCKSENNINHDDGYGYEENELHEQTCTSCGKMFKYNTIITYTYNVYCYNNLEHKFPKPKVGDIVYVEHGDQDSQNILSYEVEYVCRTRFYAKCVDYEYECNKLKVNLGNWEHVIGNNKRKVYPSLQDMEEEF